MYTATLNCSESFMSLLSTFPRTCWRSESSPLPVQSFLKTAMMESMMSSEWGLSIIMAAAKLRRAMRCSTVYPRAYRMFSRVSSGSSWYLSAILAILSGLNVPSVSMQITFPLPPPFSLGNCVVTHRVCASWVFPVLNSPKASVMAMVQMPPPSSSSSMAEPVVILTIFLRFQASSFPEINPWFSSFLEASSILSILASLMPLMLQSSFLVAITMLEMVQKPLVLSLAMSAALMPCSCSFSISMKLVCSTSSRLSSTSFSTSFFLSFDFYFCFMV